MSHVGGRILGDHVLVSHNWWQFNTVACTTPCHPKTQEAKAEGLWTITFPRFEIFLVNLALPSICEASSGLIRGNLTVYFPTTVSLSMHLSCKI